MKERKAESERNRENNIIPGYTDNMVGDVTKKAIIIITMMMMITNRMLAAR